MMVYLIEITGQLPAPSTTVQTLYFSDGEGYVTLPNDIPANTIYEPRVVNPGSYERYLWQPGSTRGQGAVTPGQIELANIDGQLDALIDWDFDARTVSIYRGDTSWPRAGFVSVLKGTIEAFDVTQQTVTVQIRDRRAAISDKLINPTKYGGTNVLPAGIDGTANDLKGLAKPLLLGEALNFSPPCVNTSALIYQISSAPIAAVLGVFCNGAAVTAGVARANVAALQATAPATGAYDYSLGSGTEGAYFRLGSTPGSQVVTASAQEGATAAARTAAQIVSRVMAMAGVTIATDLLGVAALDAKNPAVCGYYTGTSDTKIGDVLDVLCGSIGASWTPNRQGQFQLLRLEVPVGTPAVTIQADQLLDHTGDILVIQPSTDSAGGVPAYEVDVTYDHNWTTMQASQTAGSLSDDRRAWLAQDYRTATAANSAIWDPTGQTGRNPLSQPITISSELRALSDAQAEAARLLSVYGARHRLVNFSVTPAVAAALDLGLTVAIATSRFAFAGRTLLVTGMHEDFAADQTTVYAWG